MFVALVATTIACVRNFRVSEDSRYFQFCSPQRSKRFGEMSVRSMRFVKDIQNSRGFGINLCVPLKAVAVFEFVDFSLFNTKSLVTFVPIDGFLYNLALKLTLKELVRINKSDL